VLRICFITFALLLKSAPVGAAPPALRVTPAVSPPSGLLQITIELADPEVTAEWSGRKQVEVVITDAYRLVALARGTIALTLQGPRLVGSLRFTADPGVYAVQGARGNEALTARATVTVQGLTREGAWWLPNGLPLLGGVVVGSGFNSLGWRELAAPTGCLVDEQVRAAWLPRTMTPTDPTLITLSPRAPCACSACRQGFQQFVAGRFQQNLVEFNRAFGLDHRSFGEVDLPQPPAASPALSRMREDFHFQPFPSLIGWAKDQLRTPVLAAATLDLTPAGDDDRFHGGIDLPKLWESADGLLANATAADVPSLAPLLVSLGPASSGLELTATKPIWMRLTGDVAAQNVARMEAFFRGATGVIHSFDATPSAERLRPFADSARFLFENVSLLAAAHPQAEVAVVFPATSERLPRDGMGPSVRRDFTEMIHALASRRWSPRAIWSESAEGLDTATAPVLFVPTHGALSARFVERLKRYVEQGGRAYLEGLTLYDSDGRRTPWALRELVGVECAPLATRRVTELSLDDLFVFGRSGGRIPVEQHGVIGKTTGIRVLARFADGSPGLVWRRLGRGELFFTPARVAPLAHGAARYADFWHGIAASCARQFIHVEGDARNVRCAVLRTKGVALFGLFNYGRAQQLEVTVEAPLRVLTDLRTQRRLPQSDERARYKSATIDLPANDWLVLANADSVEALDKERQAVRAKFTIH